MAAPTVTLNSGHDMPVLGFGTWLAATGVVKTSVETAVKCGFRHIDCAWIYGNEPEVGESFKNILDSVSLKRSSSVK
jgi:diketogulonate reductase-like aldo/keto reductase